MNPISVEEKLSKVSLSEMKTGIGYNSLMLGHEKVEKDHPESPLRLLEIKSHLEKMKLWSKCKLYEGSTFTHPDSIDLSQVHTDKWLKNVSKFAQMPQTELNDFAKTQLDSEHENCANYLCPSSKEAAVTAVSCCIDLVEAVMKDEISNGFALVRPPGHHASPDESTGFCILNNVAFAAKKALDLGAKRVFIFDVDVHHGQGTQKIFYNDDRVMYFSIHRYEFGKYWPNLRESNFNYIGEGKGKGYNVNVPLNETGCDDSDYMAIFLQLVMPLAAQFNPDLILVSAGFDANIGDPLGGMYVSAQFYGQIIHMLRGLAQGKVIICLEGGYNLETIPICAEYCLRSLLGQVPPFLLPSIRAPKQSTIDSILNVSYYLRDFWNYLQFFPLQDDSDFDDWDIHTPNPKFSPPICGQSEKTESTQPSNITAPNSNCRPENIESCNIVGLVYDEKMSRHYCKDRHHPESPERITMIHSKLASEGLIERCVLLPSRHATDKEIMLVHDPLLPKFLHKTASMDKKRLKKAQQQYNSVFLNENSDDCALMAAGGVLEAVDAVVDNRCRSAVCVVRPPGHHAEVDQPFGFCLYNNIAIGAQYARKKHGIQKILILDWDVHHGNGTQSAFYDDRNVLFISLHRYENGLFFPSGDGGSYKKVGRGDGSGFNVNIGWSGGNMTNNEYIAALFRIVLPIAYEFSPDLVLVSAGFDAAVGDPLGLYLLTPEFYGFVTHCLRGLASGRVILTLEGGYNLGQIPNCMASCVKSLLGDKLPNLPERNSFVPNAWITLRVVSEKLKQYWNCLKGYQVRMPYKDEIDQVDTLAKAMEKVTMGEEACCSSTATVGQVDTNDNNIKEFLKLPNDSMVEESHLHAVVPLPFCPHLQEIQNVPQSGIDVNRPCTVCDNVGENWICLVCYEVYCSRYVNMHGCIHSLEKDHSMALSFADLSVWCHRCNAYVHNEMVLEAKKAAYLNKFGQDMPHS